jgi:predicted SAM-dependent methyltransferase
MRLNLGCSDSLRGGEWLNVDIAPAPESCLNPGAKISYQQADLALPWPWDDSSVDEIYAADIFEHIGDCQHSGDQWCGQCMEDRRGEYLPGRARGFDERHWSGRIHVMNESWRVLKPGGTLTMECPDAAKGAGHFQDPQHVSSWTPNALQYYTDGSPAHKRFAAAYGITARFNVLGVTERKYTEMAASTCAHAPQYCGVSCEVWKFAARLEAVK